MGANKSDGEKERAWWVVDAFGSLLGECLRTRVLGGSAVGIAFAAVLDETVPDVQEEFPDALEALARVLGGALVVGMRDAAGGWEPVDFEALRVVLDGVQEEGREEWIEAVRGSVAERWGHCCGPGSVPPVAKALPCVQTPWRAAYRELTRRAARQI